MLYALLCLLLPLAWGVGAAGLIKASERRKGQQSRASEPPDMYEI